MKQPLATSASRAFCGTSVTTMRGIGVNNLSVRVPRHCALGVDCRKTVLSTLLLLAGVLFSPACRHGIRNDRSIGDSELDTNSSEPLPLRVDVVALADDLASQAQHTSGRDRSRLLRAAARLRERMWRLERRSADALESIELYKQLADGGECTAVVDGELLSAELERKPVLALDVGSKLKHTSASPMCEARARRVMAMLEAFHAKAVPDIAGASVSPVGDDAESVLRPNGKWDGDGKPAVIQRVERYVSPDTARIVIVMSHASTFRVGALAENDDAGLPPRIYIDVDHSRFSGVGGSTHSGLVRNIRLATHANGSRIAVDLRYPAYRRVFYEPEPFRLVVDLARQAPSPISHRQGPRRVERVVVDPGHGGNDPGAIGPRGLREKDVTLDIAHRAAPIVARELGVATLLTRDVDEFVPLDERTARANAFGADLFVSIHCNAAENTGSDGVVTFVLDDSSDAAAARVAALENSASAAAAQELASAFRRIQDTATLERSVQFAQLLQRATVASLQGNYGHISDQGVRRAGFYVLAGALMPAVLYEVSFISNPDAEIRLNTGDYRQKLANAIVNAIRAYREGI